VNLAQHILCGGIRLYRWLASPALTALFGAQCRFEPSCSAYGLEAVQTHGAARGGWLALRRVCRCQPWGGCGHDPVPDRSAKFNIQNSKFTAGSAGAVTAGK